MADDVRTILSIDKGQKKERGPKESKRKPGKSLSAQRYKME